MKLEINYCLYDGRFITNPERAICYECCESLKEARKNKDDYGDDTVIVKTTIKGVEIVNQEIITK